MMLRMYLEKGAKGVITYCLFTYKILPFYLKVNKPSILKHAGGIIPMSFSPFLSSCTIRNAAAPPIGMDQVEAFGRSKFPSFIKHSSVM